jgi:hypothetical protein
MKKPAITLGALFLLACGAPTLKFSGVGEARTPKPPNCQITVYSASPTKPHDELGVITIRSDNTGFLTKLEDVMKVIQPEVCKAGGDAAVAQPNQYGTYVKATVLSSELSKAPVSGPIEEDTGGGEAPKGDEAPKGGEAPKKGGEAPKKGAVKL